MDIKQLEAAIEALLFASGEPMPIDRMAQVLETDKTTLQKVLNILTEKKEAPESGIKLIRIDDCYQFITKSEFAVYIRSALDIRRNMPLSSAAMETLAIIAYNQPVTKGYIEQVRGVDSNGIVTTLENKGLIEERGRLDVPGRPVLYGTTLDFLRCFGLKSLNELPKIEDKDIAEENPAEKQETE